MISQDAGIKRATPWLLLLMLLHFSLAVIYAQVTPYRTAGILVHQKDPTTGENQRIPDVGAPDERQHANYIKHLQEDKGFPVLIWEIPDPANPEQVVRNPDLGETYQSHQPPLFYLLAQGWSAVVGADPAASSGIRIRWLNALIGAFTVSGVFFLGYWGTRRPAIALAAAALTALLPMNLAMSGAISNDPLLFLICTWAMATSALILTEGWNWKRAVILGVIVGLGSLTKTTAIGLFPVLLVLGFVRMKDEQALMKMMVSLLLAVLVAVPWWMRNKGLYGDALGVTAFNEAFVGSPQAQMFIDAIGANRYWTEFVGYWTGRSFIGAFGYMDIFFGNDLYAVFGGLVAIGFFGSFLWLAKKESRLFWLLNAGFFLVILALFVRFNLQYFQGQARYLFPAIGAISVLVAMGWTKIAANRATIVAVAITAIFLALNVYILSELPEQFRRRTPDLSASTQTQL